MKNKYLCILLFLVLSLYFLSGCEAASPEPGAVLEGAINMDSAASAGIVFKVSDDGASIKSVSLNFTELKCEGFSAGSSSTTVSSNVPITNGEFTFTSKDIGEITGKFTTATSAEGSAHFAFYNGQAECGTWDWSAKTK